MAEIAAVGGREFCDISHLGSENPLVEQAIRRLAQEGGTGPSAPMEDVAQAQRAVQRKEKLVIEKRHVLDVWQHMDDSRPYGLTDDLEKKLGQTVHMLARRLISDAATFMAAAFRVAPDATDRMAGRKRGAEGSPYEDATLQRILHHSDELSALDGDDLA